MTTADQSVQLFDNKDYLSDSPRTQVRRQCQSVSSGLHGPDIHLRTGRDRPVAKYRVRVEL